MANEQPFLQCRFFKALPLQYCELMEKTAFTAIYRDGQYLFHEGNRSEHFFYIIKGKVALELHMPPMKNISFETIPKGHFVGWSWLFEPFTWIFDGRAVGEEVEVMCFDAVEIRKEAERDHEFGYYLYKYFSTLMSQRLMSSRMQLMDIYGKREGQEFL